VLTKRPPATSHREKRRAWGSELLTIKITVSVGILATLHELSATGLHGRTPENVAEELLREQLRKVLGAGEHKLGANAP
jgi:hypothetical protein